MFVFFMKSKLFLGYLHLIIPYELLKISKLIGQGSTSEVFLGLFLNRKVEKQKKKNKINYFIYF